MGDVGVFETVTQSLFEDFQRNPFDYGTEDVFVPDLYRRLRVELAEVLVPVTFGRKAGNDSWKVKEATTLESKGAVSRVRPEVRFVHEDGIWRDGGVAFDMVVFAPTAALRMQSKRTGPSNVWDTENEVSVLCEVKHSKNGSIEFDKLTKDVTTLASLPCAVGRRVLLFVDWWPTYHNGDSRLERVDEWAQTLSTEDGRSNPVTVEYLPRGGEPQSLTISV
jgi:hypothetical protein